MVRIDRLLVHPVAAAHVVLQLEAVLGVHRVALLVDPPGKGGADEELGELVEPRSKKPLSMSKKKLVNPVPVQALLLPP